MSRKIIIIGTLHAGLTPNDELAESIKSFNPGLLLVEIANEDIERGEISSYPPEMIFAYIWAKENNIKVAGFDSKINVFRDGITPEDNTKTIDRQRELMCGLSWRDFNEIENDKLLDVDGLDQLIDVEKDRAREREMLQNINKELLSEGVIVIITGTGHLNFFEQNIKEAILPFRK